MAYGSNAHVHAVHTASFSPNKRRVIRNSGRQFSAEKKLLMVNSIHADAREYTPNTLNTPAISTGYSGGSHAVGPVTGPNGFENPCPVASAWPIRPISQPKPKFWSLVRNLYVCAAVIHPTRSRNATSTIQNVDVLAVAHQRRNQFVS